MKRLQHHGARRRGRQAYVGADETEPLTGDKKPKYPMGTTIMAAVIWLVFLPFFGYCMWFLITGAYINGVDGRPRNLNITNHTIVNTLDVAGSMTCSGDPIDHACLPENVTQNTLNVTGSATINDLNMVGNAMCENALSSSCIPLALNIDNITVNNLLDAQDVDLHGAVTCDSAISEDCIPKNLTLDQLTVGNLTAIDFVHLNMMDLNETFINVKTLNVEDSMTCTNSNVINQTCFDLSGKTCTSPIDPNCIPPITSAMIQDGTIVDDDINAAANIQGSKLASNSVTSTQIQDGTIVGGDIAGNTIASGNIISLQSSKITCDAALGAACIPSSSLIVDADISPSANIQGSKLAVGSVDTNRLLCTGTRIPGACRPSVVFNNNNNDISGVPINVGGTIPDNYYHPVQLYIPSPRNAYYYVSVRYNAYTAASYGNNYFGYKGIITYMEVVNVAAVPVSAPIVKEIVVGETHNGGFEYSSAGVVQVPAGDHYVRMRFYYNGDTAGDAHNVNIIGAHWSAFEVENY